MKKGHLILLSVLSVGIVAVLLFRETTGKENTSVAQTEPTVNTERAAAAGINGGTATSKAEMFRLQKDQILARLATGKPYDINTTFNVLVPALVNLDPRAAAAFAQSPEAGKWRQELMMVVAQSWATINPDDAQDWASKLENPADEPRFRDTMVSYVAFSVANIDAPRAIQVLEQCKINDDREEIMVENLAQQWADQPDKGLESLTQYIDKMPEGEKRDGYYARVANAEARVDAAKAATIVSEKIAPGSIQQEAAMNIVRQWAWNDRTAATAWVNQFPPGETHDRAYKELVDTIARREGTTPKPVSAGETATANQGAVN